ncbi:alcohol dehydrogenase catalytic domain-containing protein [Streptomyces sp. NPDC050564]|uniref:alcohol dehydrogenase catalytic domain-containing protein n=1 Tax=Streptomyces sp. NPDC050564 TaxID=3365631 RepID=UPI00378B8D25
MPLLRARDLGDTVTVGHEVSGTIVELGPEVSQFGLGQRVVLQASDMKDGQMHTRGVDFDGGWAEYALASVESVFALPDSIPFERLASRQISNLPCVGPGTGSRVSPDCA